MATVPHQSAALALDAMTGRAAIAARTLYVVLLTAAPVRGTTTMATMAELTAPGTNGYSRLAYGPTAPAVVTGTAAAPALTTANAADLLWSAFTVDLAPITHLALVSAATGTVGDFVQSWDAATVRDPAINDGIRVPAGLLSLSY